MFQAETYNIPSNLEEIRNWRRSLDQIGFEHVHTEVSLLARTRRDRLDFLFIMLMTEFVCKSRTSTSTSTCQENSTSPVGWIGIEFGQATEN